MFVSSQIIKTPSESQVFTFTESYLFTSDRRQQLLRLLTFDLCFWVQTQQIEDMSLKTYTDHIIHTFITVLYHVQ